MAWNVQIMGTPSDRGSKDRYPGWEEGKPNLQTFLLALNKSQPIVNSQFELVWSRWPRTIFFAKNITIPGVSVNTIEINHAGFTVQIPTHSTYENTEVTINIIADKEGFHYYDIRNMVFQTGQPLVAGDTRATIGNNYNLSPSEDNIEVRLRNSPDQEAHHHWILHNFHPIGIGDMELSTDGSSFAEFELKGTITHITYDCGHGGNNPSSSSSPMSAKPSESQPPQPDESTPDTSDNEPRKPDEDVPIPAKKPQNKPTDKEWDDSPADPEKYPPVDQVDLEAGGKTDIDNDNCSIHVKTASHVGLKGVDDKKVSPNEQKLADQCNEKLQQAQDELADELAKIAQMPADPNFTPVTTRPGDVDTVQTPKPGQEEDDEEYDGDSAGVGVTGSCTFKSAAQKEAFDNAMQRYKEKTSHTLESYQVQKHKVNTNDQTNEQESHF